MDNNEKVEYELKPGFSLVKYGEVLTFNFNNEFAQRLKNVLADFHKNSTLKEPVLGFFKQLCYCMELPAGEQTATEGFVLERFEHVFTVSCENKFAQSLSQVFNQFLTEKRVSPALFSFAKQLEGCLFPRRLNSQTRYADEF